ncbi:hypothetical protein F383_27440 [Gossypium arboreum]|uniref:Uncharacterized protein n=1 Tax=Gossypium arboreum TaxID=29729 RepID=A0A0B0PDF3_GOSAR|nr:hypothetical protein F383_27440 [Gossypium arboreum]
MTEETLRREEHGAGGKELLKESRLIHLRIRIHRQD